MSWPEDYDQCARILEKDLFNRTKSFTDSIEKDASVLRFFALSEDDAYESYKDNQTSSGSGNGTLSLEIFELLKLGGSGGGNSSLSKEQFKEKFRNTRNILNRVVELDKFSHANSVYETQFVDQGSVRAWESCMASQSGEPKFRASIQMKNANTAFVKLYYFLGAYAGQPKLTKLKVTVIGNDEKTYEMPTGKQVFQVNVSDLKYIAINGISYNDNTGFSSMVAVPMTKKELNQKACVIQNAKMLAGGGLSDTLYQGLESVDHQMVAVSHFGSFRKSDGMIECSVFLQKRK